MNRNFSIANVGSETVSKWEEDAMEGFREENWLGSPNSSVEMHILNNTRPVRSTSVSRLRPYADNLSLIAAYRDRGAEEIHDKLHEQSVREELHNLNSLYNEGSIDIVSYVQDKIDVVPIDISLDFRFSELEVEGLSDTLDEAEDIQDSIMSSTDMAFQGTELSPFAEGDQSDRVLSSLEEDTALQIHFLYKPEEEVLEEYREIMWDDYGQDFEVEGVPTTYHLGNGEPYIFCSCSEEIGIDTSEIERKIT